MGDLRCSVHPSVPTALRCSSCERPICLDCGRQSAVGMKCPACAAPTRRARNPVGTRRVAAAAVSALAVGVAGGLALGLLGFRSLLLGIVIGVGAGEAAGRASRGLGGAATRAAASVCAGGGVVFGALMAGLPFRNVLVTAVLASVFALVRLRA